MEHVKSCGSQNLEKLGIDVESVSGILQQVDNVDAVDVRKVQTHLRDLLEQCVCALLFGKETIVFEEDVMSAQILKKLELLENAVYRLDAECSETPRDF